MFQRVKQMADQALSRTGKIESSNDELHTADRRVEQLKTAISTICKKFGSGSGSVGQALDPHLREKRLKKITEYNLGQTFQEAKFIEEESLFKHVLQKVGSAQIELANEIADHEIKLEQLVYDPFNSINSEEIPSVTKAKKTYMKLIVEKDSANNRYQVLQRHNNESNFGKLKDARDELEEVESKLEQARDGFASEMFSLLSKETQLSNTLLQYLKLQRAYHESALQALKEVIPELESQIDESGDKPVFNFPIEQHLRVTGRTIAYPIEICVCSIVELGLKEEGILRITGANSRMKRLKLALDSGIFKLPLAPEYRDVHVMAGVLKLYLRELPEPLLTFRLYEAFVGAIKMNSTEEARLQALWEVVYQLPEPNLINLRYLVKFLSTLTRHHTTNKMTPGNIAIVVGPNLLRNNDVDLIYNNTPHINCIVELLVKHADWFFKDDVEFFVTMTKDELLPDLYEYGFSPSFSQGVYHHNSNPGEQPNGDNGLSKSMIEHPTYSTLQTSHDGIKPRVAYIPNQTHSRSNSNDTSLILIDSTEIRRAQSNSSLSDHSSPPQGSPKLPKRRQRKQLAPAPPVLAADKNANTSKDVNELDKPDKPPRPAPVETKPTVGVQTINRATYNKGKQRNPLARKLSTSRENLNELGLERTVCDIDDKPNKNEKENQPLISSVQTIVAQHGTVNKMTISDPGVNSKDKPRPVAAPRTVIPGKLEPSAEVNFRPKSSIDLIPKSSDFVPGSKPTIPERPAGLRPQSFRMPMQKNNSMEMLDKINDSPNPGETLLERTHLYTVDKQQPTFIQVGNSTNSPESEDGNKNSMEAEKQDDTPLTSQTRKLSQSEGNILDVPPSPRPYHKPPPRPQIPAPPPPVAYVSQKPAEVLESTNL